MSATKSRAAFASTLGASLLLACLAVAGGSWTNVNRPTIPGDSASTKQPQVVFQLLDAQSSPLIFSRASSARDALGFPVGVRRAGKHVQDSFQHSEYDEVDELDAAGRPLSLTQFDASGRLMSAVRLDDNPRPTKPIARESAIQVAQRGAVTAGASVHGPMLVDADIATDGWTVRWERTENGIPVRGDETRIQIRPDGAVQSLARVEHQLAAEPARSLKADQARQIVAGQADRWFAATASRYTIQTIEMQWVAPNGAFDPSKPIDPQPVYRLAWVANVKPTGQAASYLWMVTLYLDAGDGSVFGGDFVE